MADIQIIIGYETVTQADQAFKILDKTVKSTARQYEQAFNKITGWQKKFSNEQNKVNASLNTQHLAQQKSNKSARDSAKAFEDAARAVEKEAAALRSLRMATDVVYRNQQKRLQMKKLLKAAIAAETMTTEQAIVALKRYNAAQMSSTKVMGMAKNKMNGSNVAVQQLGYQMGDFAVQVQGGTSAFVAFSQQATQLVGILPMVAGPLGLSMKAAIALSAALGVLIPIGSAVGRMFFEMKDDAKKAESSTKGLEDRIKSLTESLKEYGRVNEAVKLGVTVEFKDASDNIEEAKKALAEAETAYEKIQETALAIAQGGGIDISRLWTDPEGDLAAAKKAVDEAKRLLESLTAKELKDQQKLIAEKLAGQESVIAAIQQEASFQGALFGMTSKEQERANDLRAFQNQLIEDGIKPMTYQYAEALKYYNIMVSNKEAVANHTQALGDAAKAQELLSSTGDSYETQLHLVNLQIEALKAGKDAEVVSFIEGERLKVTAIYETSKALHLQTGNVIALAEASLTFLDAMSSLDSLSAAKAKLGELKSPDSSGGGGGPKENAFEKLKKETDRRRDLLKMSEAQATVTKGVWKLEDSLGKDRAKYSKENIEALVKRGIVITENERLAKEAADQQKELSNSITGAMETGFMAMIDGTMSVKDAFKSMAAAIIKELLYIMVVKKAVAAITGFFGFADGGAFSGGSEIKAYADGGVVGGPTTFPMAGGKTGLMGEAGPEAIMPLKRGANGKLGVQMEGSGGGDTYVTNNHYSISANTSEDTKRLVTQTIQQATPTITANTKASIMNDRRRGGQMKSVFG
jgi:hypothetical protein